MLQGRGWRRLFSRPAAICADLERLPLASQALDFIWCNMALHWLGDPLPALQEFRRALAPEGLLMFSALGPDTLKELRAAAGAAHVHDFIDMHDIGDMLVAAGFSAPVMDMEIIRMTYAGPAQLAADLKNTGQTNARADRPRGLAPRRFRDRLNVAAATFEIVYGHAWAGAPRANQEPKTVRVFKRMP
jgi:malonyl-CoA O-methyltransferase